MGNKASMAKGHSFGDVVANGRKGGLANQGKPKSEKHKEALRETWRKKRSCSTLVSADSS